MTRNSYKQRKAIEKYFIYFWKGTSEVNFYMIEFPARSGQHSLAGPMSSGTSVSGSPPPKKKVSKAFIVNLSRSGGQSVYTSSNQDYAY